VNEVSPTRSAVIELKDERRAMHEGYVFLDEKCLLLAGEILRELARYGELQRALRERVRVQEEAAHKAEASAKTAAAPAAAGAASGTFGTVREAHDVLLREASFLRQQVAQDPLAFLLPRAVTWGAVAQLPTASADGTACLSFIKYLPPPVVEIPESRKGRRRPGVRRHAARLLVRRVAPLAT